MLEIFLSIYFVIFILIWNLCIIGNSKELKENIPFSGFCICILILVVGLRWNTGTDWQSYKNLFDKINLNNINSIQHFDVGYKWFNLIIKYFTDDYSVLLLFDALLSITLIHFALKKIQVNTLICILIFYIDFCIAHYFGSNRRIIAMGFVFVQFVYIFLGKYKRALLCCFLAFIFHRSSIVSIFAFLIPKRGFSTKKYFFILFSCLILGATGVLFDIILVVVEKINLPQLSLLKSVLHYLKYGKNDTEQMTLIHYILASCKRFLFLFLILYFNKKTKQKSNLFNYFFNLYICSICAYFLLSTVSIFQFLSTYFAMSEIVLWGIIFYNANLKHKKILLITLLFIGIIQVQNSFPMYKNLYIPYISTLSKYER